MIDVHGPGPDAPKLYIHIGAAKSGSSAIQSALLHNRDRLRRLGYLVPTPELKPSGAISGGHVPFFERLLPVSDRGISRVHDQLRTLRSHLIRHRLRAIVISAENLFNTDEFARLFEPIQDEFNLRIILYIRRQDEYAVAAWNQWYFKSNDDFGAWATSVIGRLANWDVIVRRWESKLPHAHFDVRLFDRTRLPEGNIVLDFMDAIGVERTGTILPSDDTNRSLNEIAMRVAARNSYLFDGPQDHRFLEFLRQMGHPGVFDAIETGLYFTDAQRREFLGAYADSNERIRARYFADVEPGHLFDRPDSPGESPSAEAVVDRREFDILWAALFRMWLQIGGDKSDH